MLVIRILRDYVPVLLALFLVVAGNNPLELKTTSGKVRGFKQSTVVRKSVYTFLGIPYGAPTGGENRFGPPKAAEPWDGTLEATTMPRPCYQSIEKKFKNNILASNEDETEDCLKLNVWAPIRQHNEKRAVLVWIHGGGFTSGSSSIPLYNGATLAAHEDVLVVSINYRLSVFGFLYLDHPLAPGNVGLMDQNLALQWVKNNIEAFGGDPEKVTIFGESAGGASVGLHLLAPSSLDLFKNAILQSGTAVSLWATSKPEVALKRSLSLAKKAGCSTQGNNREETIRCLQGLNGETLSNMMLDDRGTPTIRTLGPIVDGKFLPSNPADLLSKGKICSEKNVLIGFNKEDGSMLLPFIAPELEVSEESTYTEEQILQVMSSLTKFGEPLTDLELSLVKFMYTNWNSSPQDRLSARQQLLHYFTDRWFGCSAVETANKLSDKGSKVFLYRFDHVLENVMGFAKLPRWMGSSHGDELPFVFGHSLKNDNVVEARLAKQVMRYWANFARQGDPNDGYLEEWPQYTTETKLRLQIDGKRMTVDKTDRRRECVFCEEIFPKTESMAKK